MAENTKENRALKRAAWEAGFLEWKLPAYCRPVFQQLRDNPQRISALNCSRRWRKTTMGCVTGLEYALQHADSLVRIVAPSAKQASKAVQPIMRQLLQDAPQGLIQWRQQDQCYKLRNGSEIHIAGADAGGADSLRGQTTHIAIIDEAGFVDDLEYLVKSSLMPQLLSTNGRLIALSTPPVSGQDHYFFELFMDAQTRGAGFHKTIHETDYPAEAIEEFKKQAGGEHTATWRREWLAEFVVDETRAVVPEFKESVNVGLAERPAYFSHLHRYAVADIGIRDLSVILFAYYDFPKARIVIEAERVMNGPEMTTERFAKMWKETEVSLWGDLPVYTRRADAITDLLINDMSALHGLPMSRPDKDAKETQINELRIWVESGRVFIDPSCEGLIRALKYGTWDTKRKDFERTKTLGHLDAVAALSYLIRAIDEHTNPIPATFNKSVQEIWQESRLARGKEQAMAGTIRQLLNHPKPKTRKYA